MQCPRCQTDNRVLGEQDGTQVAFWPQLYLGRADEALAAAARAQALAGVDNRGQGYARIPVALAQAGRLSEAREELGAALNWFRVAAGEGEVYSVILADLLYGAVAVEDREAVALLAGRLAGVTAVRSAQVRIANAARALGRAAVLLGDPAAGLNDYQRSLEWATRVRHRPEIALTRLEIAELLAGQASTPSSGERAATEALDHLDSAIPELEAMGMRPALEQALRLKERLASAHETA